MERTPFVRRAFKTFDADGSGQLVRRERRSVARSTQRKSLATAALQDFREMVFSVWNLCTMDSQGLLMLMFDLYDKDASGTMSACSRPAHCPAQHTHALRPSQLLTSWRRC